MGEQPDPMVGNGEDKGSSEGQKGFAFPCSFPLKVVGKNTNEFYSVVVSIIEKHVGQEGDIIYSSRTSKGDKYLSITANLFIESREQLEAIYTDLNACDLVVMTL
jgi:uncharacterized protein